MAASISSDDGDIGFQIAPMVDVVFVLMLFFMACVGAQQAEKVLTVNLPSHGRGDVTPIVVEISADGVVSMNGEIYGAATDKGLARLRVWMGNTVRSFGNRDPVVIRPAADARHERIIDVLNCAAASGVKNLTFW